MPWANSSAHGHCPERVQTLTGWKMLRALHVHTHAYLGEPLGMVSGGVNPRSRILQQACCSPGRPITRHWRAPCSVRWEPHRPPGGARLLILTLTPAALIPSKAGADAGSSWGISLLQLVLPPPACDSPSNRKGPLYLNLLENACVVQDSRIRAKNVSPVRASGKSESRHCCSRQSPAAGKSGVEPHHQR